MQTLPRHHRFTTLLASIEAITARAASSEMAEGAAAKEVAQATRVHVVLG